MVTGIVEYQHRDESPLSVVVQFGDDKFFVPLTHYLLPLGQADKDLEGVEPLLMEEVLEGDICCGSYYYLNTVTKSYGIARIYDISSQPNILYVQLDHNIRSCLCLDDIKGHIKFYQLWRW